MATELQQYTVPTKVTGNNHFASEFNQMRNYHNSNIALLGANKRFINSQSDLDSVNAESPTFTGYHIISTSFSLTANKSFNDGAKVVYDGGIITLGNYDLGGDIEIICPESSQLFAITGTGRITGLVKNSVIYAAWLGIHTDGITDNKAIIEALVFITRLEWDEKYYVLKEKEIVFPLGHIATSDVTCYSEKISWRGYSLWAGNSVAGTVFTPLSDGQTHMIDFGYDGTRDNTHRINGLKIKDIAFASATFEYDGGGINNSNLTVTEVQCTDSLVVMDHVGFLVMDNVSFQRGSSRALRLKEVWETQVSKLHFANIGRWDKSLIYVDSTTTNNSAWQWHIIHAEAIRGSLIDTADPAQMTDVYFGTINYEFGSISDGSIKDLPGGWDDIDGVPLISINRAQTLKIDNIQATYLSNKYENISGTYYAHSTLFKFTRCKAFDVDSIQLQGTGHLKIVHVPKPYPNYGDTYGEIRNIKILDVSSGDADTQLTTEIHSNNFIKIKEPQRTYWYEQPKLMNCFDGGVKLQNINEYARYSNGWNTFIYDANSLYFNKQSFIYCDADAWTTSTSYSKDDLVKESDIIYLCLEDHTSGTFVTDLAADKWIEKSDKSTQSYLFRLLPDVFNAVTDKRVFVVIRVRANTSSNIDVRLTVNTGTTTNYTIINGSSPSSYEYHSAEIPFSAIGSIQDIRILANGGVPVIDAIGFYTKDLPDLYGDTASRPGTNYTGQLYYDTDLLKEIVWNGSAWVNTDGSSLT